MEYYKKDLKGKKFSKKDDCDYKPDDHGHGYSKKWDDDDCCKNDHKDHKEKCDCCCVPGIREQLERLIGRNVVIVTDAGVPITGVLSSVDCDCDVATVAFAPVVAIAGITSIPTTVSLCEINYVMDVSLVPAAALVALLTALGLII